MPRSGHIPCFLPSWFTHAYTLSSLRYQTRENASTLCCLLTCSHTIFSGQGWQPNSFPVFMHLSFGACPLSRRSHCIIASASPPWPLFPSPSPHSQEQWKVGPEPTERDKTFGSAIIHHLKWPSQATCDDSLSPTAPFVSCPSHGRLRVLMQKICRARRNPDWSS